MWVSKFQNRMLIAHQMALAEIENECETTVASILKSSYENINVSAYYYSVWETIGDISYYANARAAVW